MGPAQRRAARGFCQERFFRKMMLCQVLSNQVLDGTSNLVKLGCFVASLVGHERRAPRPPSGDGSLRTRRGGRGPTMRGPAHLKMC